MPSLFASVAVAQAPSIEGTYRVSSRTLQDGTVVTPPDVMGLQTSTKTSRNFNILSKDADGYIVSRSIVAAYTLTPPQYIETTLFHIFIPGQETRREVSTPPQRSSVTVEAGRIQFLTEQRVVVYEGHRFTATGPASVDVWETVE
ncbi:MAG TPA: hypothetical protein VNP04_13325 [Alphaproteobacteria bacterium]|nr:hypothetical protein [Alphaproteobacteria bacterium]